MSIRSTSKAIIVHDGKVLLNRCQDRKNGDYYSLPGGGQNKYETFTDALIRECREETGYVITSIRFAALCEEICCDLDLRENRPEYAHKVYHIFLCSLSDDPQGVPTEKDGMQLYSEWIEMDRLQELRLLPTAVGKNIMNIVRGASPMFLGSEHIAYNHG